MPKATPQHSALDAKELAKLIASYADNNKAEDIVILDVEGISSITDVFVLCSGNSLPHLKAIAREIKVATRDNTKQEPRGSEGNPESLWLVLDYVDVMVHIFHHEKRPHYALEQLWSDAAQLEWTPQTLAKHSTSQADLGSSEQSADEAE